MLEQQLDTRFDKLIRLDSQMQRQIYQVDPRQDAIKEF